MLPHPPLEYFRGYVFVRFFVYPSWRVARQALVDEVS